MAIFLNFQKQEKNRLNLCCHLVTRTGGDSPPPLFGVVGGNLGAIILTFLEANLLTFCDIQHLILLHYFQR